VDKELKCKTCGDVSKGHEDDSSTQCRWCVWGWTPDKAVSNSESKAHSKDLTQIKESDCE